jgi:hypothetical protein
MNKRTLLIIGYAVVMFVTAPTILGNAIITGKAAVSFLAISILSILAIEAYEKWKSARAGGPG